MSPTVEAETTGLPKSIIATLQRVQNAAARLVLGLGPHDHIADALASGRGPYPIQAMSPDAYGAQWTSSAISQRRSTSSLIFIWSFRLVVGNNSSICEA